MRKNLYSLTFAIIIIIGIFVYFQLHQSGKVEEMKTSENFNFKFVDMNQVLERFKIIEEVKTKKVETLSVEVKEEIKRPIIADIPLEDDVLDYIWKKSLESDYSYELLLAFAKVESDFNQNLSSKTRDHGMYQIHTGTDKWIAEQLGLKKYNLMDVYTSTDFAVYYLTYLREQYRDQGMSEEEVFIYNIVAYNRGIKGAYNYIAKHGENVDYLKKIKKFKEQYERTEIEN